MSPPLPPPTPAVFDVPPPVDNVPFIVTLYAFIAIAPPPSPFTTPSKFAPPLLPQYHLNSVNMFVPDCPPNPFPGPPLPHNPSAPAPPCPPPPAAPVDCVAGPPLLPSFPHNVTV